MKRMCPNVAQTTPEYALSLDPNASWVPSLITLRFEMRSPNVLFKARSEHRPVSFYLLHLVSVFSPTFFPQHANMTLYDFKGDKGGDLSST